MDDQQQHSQLLREKYLRVVQDVWKKPDDCPICDSTYWNIGDLVEARLRGTDTDVLEIPSTRKAYVYAPITCLYCGYTIFFHTGVLDVRGTEDVKAIPPLRAPGEAR
jgi:predicted nucleic-acid-binding Zn-ribbon protein